MSAIVETMANSHKEDKGWVVTATGAGEGLAGQTEGGYLSKRGLR